MGNPLNKGLVLYLSMSEGVGSKTNDHSPHQNNGTINGASWIDGKIGKALDFDGTNDLVSIADSDSLDIINEITIAFWMNATATSGWRTPIEKLNSFQTEYVQGAGNKFRWNLGVGAGYSLLSSNSNINDLFGAWHHIVLTYDGVTMTIYIDGKLDNSKSQTGDIITNTSVFYLGSQTAIDQFFKGKLDEVRIYNRVLSAEEIRTLYNEGAFDLNNGLVLHLPFSEGIGSKVGDISQYLNNGTLNGPVFLRPYENDTTDEGDSPLVIYDDDETFWSIYHSGSGSYDITLSEESTIKQKGTSSLKIVVGAGTYSYMGCLHDFGSEQDWSGKDFISLWIYGANTGLAVSVELYQNVGFNFGWSFTDNFSGWQRKIFLFSRSLAGANDLTKNRSFYIYYNTVNQAFTSYLDRTIVDVGNWRHGEALDFDGVDDEVQIADADSLDLTNALSIFCWIKTQDTVTPKYPRLISKLAADSLSGYEFLLYISENYLSFIFGTGIATVEIRTASAVTFDDDVWHFIGITYDGTNYKLWLDGNLVYQVVNSNYPAINSTILRLGNKINSTAQERYDGLLDEVRIYNRALSSEEIRTLYNMKGDA